MKKSIITLLFILLIFISNSYATDVGTPLQLYNVRSDLTGSYTQTADIDLSGYPNWVPIAGGGLGTKFTGSYDGGGYKITNLVINSPNTVNVGLFGHIGRDAVIKNVKLETVNVKGARGTGSLVGRVTGDEDTYIEYCYANGGTVVGDGATGGLVGSNNSYSESPSNRNQHPTIQYCWAFINVSWSQKVDSGADKFGGLVGCNQKGKTYFSYARGTVTVDNDPAVTVSNIDGTVPSRIGGLIGCIIIRGLVESSYSTGLVTTNGSVANVGGLVGKGGTGGSGGNAYACFYDNLTSTNPSTSATPYVPSGVTSESTTNMKTESTYTNAGWDFTNIWTIAADEYPTIRSNEPTIQNITVTDGSLFYPSVTPGNDNQVIGRFSLYTSAGTSYLERVTIMLNGTRAGASNFKLWESTDDTFNSGSDPQYDLTIASDPGEDESISFSKAGFSVTTTEKYYFLTCSVASDATGLINAKLQDNSSLNFYGGEISGSALSDALLSNGGATLPVELSAFTGQYIENTPTLYWTTQSETDNMGWFVYRNIEEDFTTSEKISEFIEGHGTTTQQQSYIYEDNIENPEVEDTYYYWLESIDFSGMVNHYDKVAIMQIPDIHNPDPHIAVPSKYGLQTGPNPFNSDLTVSYMLPKTDIVRIEIYNMTGQLVAEFNEGLKTGDRQYTLDWNGKDLYGQNVLSGVLLIKLITSEGSETTKAILLR